MPRLGVEYAVDKTDSFPILKEFTALHSKQIAKNYYTNYYSVIIVRLSKSHNRKDFFEEEVLIYHMKGEKPWM